MNAVEAALGRCSRDAHGQLKLSWLWADPRKARNQLSAIIKRGKLGERVTMLKGGKGIFAPEEVARQVAGLIQPELLWREAEACPAQDVAALGVVPEQEVTSPASNVDAADLGQQLSTLLGHPVNFQLRATPNNWPALIDITMIFTGLNNNQAGKVVRRLLEEHPEFQSSRLKFKFEGRGRQTIDVVPLTVALDFAFLLPGKAAAQMRRQAAALVVRYLGGDVTLVDEVYTNRHAQESLAAIPAEQRTPLEQAVRSCGEAVETQAQPASAEALFVPRKPLVIQDRDSVGLPGSDHLYAAGRHGENLIKIGVSKDVLQRMRELPQSFGGQYELLAVWPHEAVLETLVLELLKTAKASVGSSREHFNAHASFEQICQIVDSARHLHRLKMDLEAMGLKRRREEAEFEEELADRALKRRQQEMQMQQEEARTSSQIKQEEAWIKQEEARIKQEEARTSLLLELVRTGDEEAKRVFLAALAARS